MQSEKPQSSVPFYWPFKRVFYGWAVVGASVLATFSSVPMYGPVLSLFMKPVGDDMGWSRGEMSIAFTAGSILGGLSSSVVGRLLDRYGARVSIVVAGMIMTAVLLGLALMQEIWQFWIIFGTGRAAAIVGINLGASVAVANWFIRKRGRTVSFVGIGLRSGQSLFPLFLAPIIVALTWRHAYALLAIVAIAFIVIPAWLFVRRRPEDLGLLPDGDQPESEATDASDTGAEKPRPQRAAEEVSWTLGEARRTLTFWLLVLGITATVFSQTAVNLHAVASLQDRGVGGGFAGVFVFFFAGIAAISAYFWGSFVDRYSVRLASILAAGFSAGAMLALIAADNVVMAVMFAVLFGMGVGGWTVAQTMLFANYFGRRHLGAIRGTSQMFTGPVGAMGPLMAGFIHDFTASYIVSFQIFLGAFLLVMTIIFFARPPKRRSSA